MNTLERHFRPDGQQKQFFRLIHPQTWFRLSAAMLAVGLAVGTFVQDAIADDDPDEDQAIPFADVGIIFETNFTDRDTGIQISLDGEPWKEIEVKGSDGQLVEIESDNNLEKFGLTDVGTSKNAVMTQIWIALCVYLLIAFLKFRSRLGKSLQQIVRLLQLNLFEKRDLMALLRGDPPVDRQVNSAQLGLL